MASFNRCDSHFRAAHRLFFGGVNTTVERRVHIFGKKSKSKGTVIALTEAVQKRKGRTLVDPVWNQDLWNIKTNWKFSICLNKLEIVRYAKRRAILSLLTLQHILESCGYRYGQAEKPLPKVESGSTRYVRVVCRVIHNARTDKEITRQNATEIT